MLTFKKRIWIDRIQTVRLYYSNIRFALADMAFGLIALFLNPYRVCSRFLQKKGAEDIYVYGETPYTTYRRIVEECGIGPSDTWMEPGSGRGKGCFWIACFAGCQVIGIEWIPTFIRPANAIKCLLGLRKIEFQLKNIEEADLSRATVVYLYGLWTNLKIPHEAKVITISEPLEGYQVLKTFWVRFPWGRTSAYLQKKQCNLLERKEKAR